AALGARADGPATTRLANRTARLAGRLDRARPCLRALERSDSDPNLDSELARLRDWAVVEVDEVGDEVERIVSRLADLPRPMLLLTRLGRLLPEPEVFGRLIAAAATFDDERGPALVLDAFGS